MDLSTALCKIKCVSPSNYTNMRTIASAAWTLLPKAVFRATACGEVPMQCPPVSFASLAVWPNWFVMCSGIRIFLCLQKRHFWASTHHTC